ncbi:CD209 antigen-like protein E [Mugil cephalus]|uniref:CD209 antigen-like protein E n=1 Tax=Mugil cephalus TaxID=48193 RepID=UPI001FB69BD6|nr:CD209 antigen-like protein E [Mugil cephalus]
MENIYVNIEELKPVSPKHSTNCSDKKTQRGPWSLYLGFTVFLCVFLFAGLIILGVLYVIKDNLTAKRNLLNANLTKELESLSEHNRKLHDSVAELSAIKVNLTELLQTSNNKLSSMTEERDLLNANLAKLRCLFEPKKMCHGEWKMFSCSCYFFSKESGSWDKGRQDCRNKGAELVVINSPEEQMFLFNVTKNYMWIGLNDREVEGTLKWVDGTPLTLQYWTENQPDNGGGVNTNEDCVHTGHRHTPAWNDLPCTNSLPWICEKLP